jgi:hypothetical protein
VGEKFNQRARKLARFFFVPQLIRHIGFPDVASKKGMGEETRASLFNWPNIG